MVTIVGLEFAGVEFKVFWRCQVSAFAVLLRGLFFLMGD